MTNTDKSISQWKPQPCNCGHRACTDWHIYPVAFIHGVGFTKKEAEAICKAHNEGTLT
jgi:hypothetical protein